MRIINENTISVRLNSEELLERGLNMLDLIQDQGQAQRFFSNLIKEIDQEEMFADSEAITFQVMPKPDSIEVIISNGMPNEEALDLLKIQAENEDVAATTGASASDNKEAEPAFTKPPVKLHQIYEFANFDDVIYLADSLKVTGLRSSLTKKDGKYYLALDFDENNFTELTPDDAWIIAGDYGKVMKSGSFKNDGKVLMAQDALENLRYYFK